MIISIRGIILAAGSSTRMGKNKLMLEVNGRPLIYNVIESAVSSVMDEVILVYGKYNLETVLPKVYNPDFANGMSTSLIRGVEGYTGDAVVFLLGDMPYITSETINLICRTFLYGSKNIVVPVYNGKRGNPVLMGKKYFQDILSTSGDKGARDIINSNLNDVAFLEVNDSSVLLDIDDVESYCKVENKIRAEK